MSLKRVSKKFPWYDSEWLSDYVSAVEFFKRSDKGKLTKFEEKMSIFSTAKGFETKYLPELIDKNQVSEFRDQILKINDLEIESHEVKSFGRHVLRDQQYFNGVQKKFLSYVESVVGEELECSYNFISLYKNTGKCEPHLDAPFAKWTLDICIEQSKPWPIYFSKYTEWPMAPANWADNWQQKVEKENEFTGYELNPGDAIIFSGTNFWHKREPIVRKESSEFCHLVFFHYIPKGTRDLVNPANWPALFSCPELADKLIHKAF